MDEFASRLLVIGLIIAGFMLFNYLAQQAAKRLREQQEAAGADPAEAASAPPPGDEPLEDIWGRTRVPLAAEPAPVIRAVPQPQAAPPLPTRQRSGTRLFRTRKDLQHAVVLMTVLGPCRALEPHEQR